MERKLIRKVSITPILERNAKLFLSCTDTKRPDRYPESSDYSKHPGITQIISISNVKVIDLFLFFDLFCFLSWDKRWKLILVCDTTLSPTGRQNRSLRPSPHYFLSWMQSQTFVCNLEYRYGVNLLNALGTSQGRVRSWPPVRGAWFPRHKHTA